MIYRFSKAEYHRLAEGQRTELLKGVIFQKMSKSPLHANFLQLLLDLIRPLVPADFHLVVEKPLDLLDSEPEPDLAITPRIRSMHDPHPSTAYLVAEISVTTQAYDEAKADVYAEALVPVYWQILPLQKTTVVHSEPQGGKYRSVIRVPFETALTVDLPGQKFSVPLGEIR